MSVQAPTIYNLTLETPGTEYSQALSHHIAYFTVKARTLADFRLAYVSGETADLEQYWTVNAGSSYSPPDDKDVIVGQLTLYFRSDTPNLVIEIQEWRR